ncbi:MAG: glycoside hydrolase family 13 protein [Candidatus Cohnella colombiensis]|uniref:Glycoside hydrolase family 13 protein n=1 Tax=Candidatus Cohnella colombiensis TaxID=3121368 RepID=A0AA95JDF5_9BACL|nr:MAG: glycoside hydrolase family 13 protein [Cohnella sp.]
MLKEAIFHRPKTNWSYSYDQKTIHIRLRTKRNDVKQVTLFYGDKYNWSVIGTQNTPMKIFAQDELFDYWLVAIEPEFRRLKYGFKLQSKDETLWFDEQGIHETEPSSYNLFFEFPFINPVDVFTIPAWVKDAVFYQIFPERFANGDPSINPDNVEEWGGEPTPYNFFGGDLQGVIDHLDYLEQLGINAIYFNPLFEAPTNHKYDTVDYMKVDPQFGTNEKLKQLVDACHARGIRVVLDAVFNHSGKHWPPFVDVREKGESSPYAKWFHVREFPLEVREGVPSYDTFSFEQNMPKLNTEHPEVQDYLLDVARYWIKEIGVDGWRLDVANEVDHAFWRKFRDVVKGVNPEAYILGEIWHDSLPWLIGDQFDAVMNYPFTEAVLDYAVRNTRDGKQFSDLAGYLLAAYPQQANEATFNLLGSHDTARLLTLSKGDKRRMKLATVIQFTFNGTPCIYYGDEVGLSGDNDPGCRKCMEWDLKKQDVDLLAFFKQLIHLRRNHRALRDGTYEVAHASAGSPAFAYIREADGERFAIVLNAGSRKASVQVEATLNSAQPQIVFGDGEVTLNKKGLKVSLQPLGYSIIRL